MASLEYAVKQLSRYGEVKHNSNGQYWIDHAGETIRFHGQGNHVICISVKATREQDDGITDYFPGVYADNISQAIRLAGW